MSCCNPPLTHIPYPSISCFLYDYYERWHIVVIWKWLLWNSFWLDDCSTKNCSSVVLECRISSDCISQGSEADRSFSSERTTGRRNSSDNHRQKTFDRSCYWYQCSTRECALLIVSITYHCGKTVSCRLV